MSSSRELIESVYQSFNARDIPAVLARMHPNVDWPNGMEGGRVVGHSNVRDYWERQWQVVDPRVEPVRIEEDESGRIVVTVHQVVRDMSGKVLLDRDVQHIYLLEDGLIRSMEIRELSPNLSSARGGN